MKQVYEHINDDEIVQLYSRRLNRGGRVDRVDVYYVLFAEIIAVKLKRVRQVPRLIMIKYLPLTKERSFKSN